MSATIIHMDAFKRAQAARAAERQANYQRYLDATKPQAKPGAWADKLAGRPVPGTRPAAPAARVLLEPSPKPAPQPLAERLRIERSASEDELMLALRDGEWRPAAEIVAEILAQRPALTGWETGFLRSMQSWAGAPTPKQARVVVKLAHHNDVPVTLGRFGSD